MFTFLEIFVENSVKWLKWQEKVVLFEKVTEDFKKGEVVRMSLGVKFFFVDVRNQRVIYLRI